MVPENDPEPVPIVCETEPMVTTTGPLTPEVTALTLTWPGLRESEDTTPGLIWMFVEGPCPVVGVRGGSAAAGVDGLDVVPAVPAVPLPVAAAEVCARASA
jgi:hypothetical protein